MKNQAESELHQVQQEKWVRIAESLKPALIRNLKYPISIVEPASAPDSFLRWHMEPVARAETLEQNLMNAGDAVILDFSEHLTGHFTFSIAGEGRGLDSPARLKLTFGEVPAEVAEPFDPHTGLLSRAWLQDEVINIDVFPATITLPRRYAFRYVKIEVIGISNNYGVRLSRVQAVACASVETSAFRLSADVPAVLRRIDEVSIHTLRECMQTVFEDGPKRDRRCWIGDLRLQALVNYVTFRDFDLVKRCLFLVAGLPDENGMVSALVAELPQPQRGHEFIIDYVALYGVTVLDYARASDDWETARELWPVVRRQMEILGEYIDDQGLFAAPQGSWVFIDWCEELDRTAAMHGVYLYALRQVLELAQVIGAADDASVYARRISAMTAAARTAFFDQEKGVFVSGPDRQVSWATQAWMVLAEVASPSEGKAALRTVTGTPETVRPGAPYMYHYVVDAMLQCGMKQEALELIQSYWGGMVESGADTFWEVYDPSDPMLSPYGNVLLNSYCHAWSCTPSYLLRSGGLI